MSPLVALAGLILTQHVSGQSQTQIVYMGKSDPQGQFIELVRSKKLSNDECKKLGLEYREFESDQFIWEKEVYDVEGEAKRISLWKKLVDGDIKPGDVIGLSEGYSAVSNSHGALEEYFGVNDNNSGEVKAQVAVMKVVTIETPSGTKTTKIPTVDESKLRQLEPHKRMESSGERPPSRQAPKVRDDDSVAIFFFGFGRDPLMKYASAEKMFHYLYNLKSANAKSLSELALRFTSINGGNEINATNGLESLTDEDKKILENAGVDLSKSKLKSVGFIPCLRVSFLQSESSSELVSSDLWMPLDLTKEVSPKVIKP